jgi:homoserine dehydrogenase
MGGTSLAKKLVVMAIKNGKHVITANKALIAMHGNELLALAKENNTHLLFEAAVAGWAASMPSTSKVGSASA